MSITNRERAKRAAQTLETYKRVYAAPGYDTQEALTDLIADLLHLARAKKLDPEKVLAMAQYHFESETQN